MKSVSLRENITELLALIAAIGGFTIVILLFFKPIPPENKELVSILGTMVIGLAVLAYGYYYGQSKKRDIIPDAGQSTTIVQKSTTTDATPEDEIKTN